MSIGPLYPAPTAGTPGLVRLTFRIQASTADGATDPDFIFPSNAPVVSAYENGAGVYGMKFSTVYPGFVGGTGSVLSADTAALGKVVLIDIADYNTTTGVLIVTVAHVDTADATEGSVDPVDLVANDWLFMDLVFTTTASDAVTGALAALTP